MPPEGAPRAYLGWLQADTPTRTPWGWAEATTTESRKEAAEAKAARDAALAEAVSIRKHCGEAEANLKALQEDQATHA